MNNKSQIGIFILLGIILLLSFGFTYYLKKEGNEVGRNAKIMSLDNSIISVKNYIEYCLKIVATNAIGFISSRGGYYILPNRYLNSIIPTAFYIYANQDISLNISTLENELATYIEQQLDYCINKIEVPGNAIYFGEKYAKVILINNNIITELHMPTRIISDKSTIFIEDYKSYIQDNKLINSFHVAKNITDSIKKFPEKLCLTCIFREANNNQLDIIIDTFNETTYVFRLIDTYDRSFVFNFAVNLEVEHEN